MLWIAVIHVEERKGLHGIFNLNFRKNLCPATVSTNAQTKKSRFFKAPPPAFWDQRPTHIRLSHLINSNLFSSYLYKMFTVPPTWRHFEEQVLCLSIPDQLLEGSPLWWAISGPLNCRAVSVLQILAVDLTGWRQRVPCVPSEVSPIELAKIHQNKQVVETCRDMSRLFKCGTACSDLTWSMTGRWTILSKLSSRLDRCLLNIPFLGPLCRYHSYHRDMFWTQRRKTVTVLRSFWNTTTKIGCNNPIRHRQANRQRHSQFCQ